MNSIYGYTRKLNTPKVEYRKSEVGIRSAILSFDSPSQIYPNSNVPYAEVSNDSIGVMLNGNGSFNLPRGSYVILFDLRGHSDKEGNILLTLNLGSTVIYSYSDQLTSFDKTLSGMTSISVVSHLNSYSLINSGPNSIICVSDSEFPIGKMVIIKIA